MTLASLHDGIDIPEYASRVPWLITQAELLRYVPQEALSISPGGWPLLQFTCLGVPAAFAFNFVNHPEFKLLGVQFNEPAPENIERVFRDTSAVLRVRLGDPNAVDQPDCHHLMWRDGRVWVDYSAGVPESVRAEQRHSLSIWYHSGVPRAWVPPKEWTLGQVKNLLNLLPGVEVVEVHCSPDHTYLGFASQSLQSLARLAHTARDANVRLTVGVNAYREANGGLQREDPAVILYRIEVPGRREAKSEESSTTLQILGIYLSKDLREQGLLGEDEAEQLVMRFNNHVG